MSGSAGLSAAKRRRAEQVVTSQSSQSQSQQLNRQNARDAQLPPRTPTRVVTPMSILEDHELRLRHIESYMKEGSSDDEIKRDETKKDVSTNSSEKMTDQVKREFGLIVSRLRELENTNAELLKKIGALENEVTIMAVKHSNLQTFAMETNSSLLKHKDTFEPRVVSKLINILSDKTSTTVSESERVSPDTANLPETPTVVLSVDREE